MKNIVLLAALMLHSCLGFSQWESLAGPFGGNIINLWNTDRLLFAKTSNGIFRSNDVGRSWHHLNIHIPENYFPDKIAIQDMNVILSVRSSMQSIGTKLFASKDSGESWFEINTPPTKEFNDFTMNGYGIYYNDKEQIWISNDFGKNWRLSKVNLLQAKFYDLISYNNHIYILSLHQIYESESNGDTWTALTVTGESYANSLFVFDSLYFAVGYLPGLMTRSEDRGKTWKINHHIDWGNSSLIKIKNNFYGNQVYTLIKSIDGGKTFNNTFIDLKETIKCMVNMKDTMVLGTENGILISTDEGKTFQSRNTGLDASSVSHISIKDNILLAVNDGTGISKFDISSDTWEHVNYASKTLTDLVRVDNYAFALRDGNKIIRSSDNGATWKNVNSVPLLNETYSKLFTGENSVLVFNNNCSNVHPLISIDYGADWVTLMGTNLLQGFPNSFHSQNGTNYIATDQVIVRTDNFGHWKVIKEVYSLCAPYDKLIVSDQLIGYIERHFDKRAYLLWISQDQGDTWKEIVANLPSENIIKGFYSVYFLDKIIIGSYTYGKFYASFDFGDSWVRFDDGLHSDIINEFTSDDEYIYAATSGQGVWRRKISDLYTTSTTAPSSINDLIIFPNPSNGNFTLQIETQFTGKGQLSISDLDGKIVMARNIDLQPAMQIEAGSLSSGVYILSLRTDHKNYTSKVIVQK